MVGVESQKPTADIRDISLSGVCFTINESVEFMTRLMMTLIFPAGHGSPNESERIESCEGAVVRCEPADSDKDSLYEVAVFFTHLEESTKEAIERYVSLH